MSLLRRLAITIAVLWSLLGVPAAQGSVSIPDRPFGVSLESFHIHADGFFDVTIGEQWIGLFLQNDGPQALTGVVAVASFAAGSGIVLLDNQEELGTLEPGVPVLGFFRANFGGSAPGKHLLTLHVTSNAGTEMVARPLFLVRSEHDPSNIDRWTMFADAGKITTTVLESFGGSNLGSLGVITSFEWVVEHNTPFAGQFSDLPFGDPWWKAFGLGFGLGGCAGWIAGAVAKHCGADWGEVAIQVGQAEKAAGGLAVAADFKDPFRRGQENTFPGPGELTLREDVDLAAQFLQEPIVGTPYSMNVSWTYTRTTNLGTHTFSVVETLTNQHFTTGRDVSFQVVGGNLIITASVSGGLEPIQGDRGYFAANIFQEGDHLLQNLLRSVVLRDDGHQGDALAGDGVYTGVLSKSALPSAPLSGYVFGFDMNNAPESAPPLEAAQEIGGVMISAPPAPACRVAPDLAIDVTPPLCFLSGSSGGPPATIQITVHDTGSGLKTINVLEATNATVPPPSFASGTTSPVVVTATKVNPSQRSVVGLEVTDVAGNSRTCDPVIALIVRERGKPVTETFTGIPQAESRIAILNGARGLSNLLVTVNGVKLRVAGLRDGQEKTLDVTIAMRPGDQNVITFTAQGSPGSSATVLIHD